METEFISWVVRGLVLLTMGGVGGLFAWQKKISSEVAVIESKLGEDNASSKDLTELKLCFAENYVRRGDYIQQVSLLGQKLDANALLLTRVDERVNQIMKRSGASDE